MVDVMTQTVTSQNNHVMVFSKTHYMEKTSYGLFTLHGIGAGGSTGNGVATGGNNGPGTCPYLRPV